jgi:hypothetical protein
MRFVIPALALTLAAVPAFAQTPPAAAPDAPAAATPAPAAPAMSAPATHARTTMEKRFDAANTTHDGHLTKAQAQAAHMTTTVRHFAAIDKDHKGYVTLDDISTYAKAQRAQRSSTAKAPPG